MSAYSSNGNLVAAAEHGRRTTQPRQVPDARTAGVGVGAGIGDLLDRWLETSPWMRVTFVFLGSAAGMLNVYRVVSGAGLGIGYRPAETPEKPSQGGTNENTDEGPRG